MKKELNVLVLLLLVLAITLTSCQKDDETQPLPLLKNNLKERGLLDDKHRPQAPKLYDDFVAREFYENPSNVPAY